MLVKICDNHWIVADYIVEVMQLGRERHPTVATINGSYIEATAYENADQLVSIITESGSRPPHRRSEQPVQARDVPGKPKDGASGTRSTVVF